MKTRLNIHFEKEGCSLLVKELQALTQQGQKGDSFGYLVFQKLDRLRMIVGTIDTLSVPYGQVIQWSPKTVVCCDEGVMNHDDIFVHVLADGRIFEVSVDTRREECKKYMSISYEWAEPWK